MTNNVASVSDEYDDFETSEPDEGQAAAQNEDGGAKPDEDCGSGRAEQLMVQPRADSLIVYEEVTVPEQTHQVDE